jgi:hypothetical protein
LLSSAWPINSFNVARSTPGIADRWPKRDPEAIDPNDPKWRIDFRLQRLKVSLLNAREGRRRFISDAGRDQALQEVEDFEAGIQYT